MLTSSVSFPYIYAPYNNQGLPPTDWKGKGQGAVIVTSILDHEEGELDYQIVKTVAGWSGGGKCRQNLKFIKHSGTEKSPNEMLFVSQSLRPADLVLMK